MAKTKTEQKAIAEAQRRQQSSVTDLAREGGMIGNRPAGGNVTVKKTESAVERKTEESK